MMRRFPNLVACALLCGGWVCQSNADNRCPGALTCDIDVANVCCPFSATARCEACAPDRASCTGEVRPVPDLARVLECSFSAKIDTARCLGRASQPGGNQVWSIETSGQLTGCGEEVGFIMLGDANTTAPTCGSWSN